MEWMILPYKRYFDFEGRSRRKEYWMYTLFYYLVLIAVFGLAFAVTPDPAIDTPYGGDPYAAPSASAQWGIVETILFGGMGIFVLGSFIPSLAVTVRRFHDQGKSGWFILLGLIPYLGGIILLVFMVLDGERHENMYGPDPKDESQADVFE